LARFGILRGSFIPPKDLRELRIVSRYRRPAGEKNRPTFDYEAASVAKTRLDQSSEKYGYWPQPAPAT
jgi:hypothetical protein